MGMGHCCMVVHVLRLLPSSAPHRSKVRCNDDFTYRLAAALQVAAPEQKP